MSNNSIYFEGNSSFNPDCEKKSISNGNYHFLTYLINKHFTSYIEYIKQYELIIKIPNIYLPDKKELLWCDYEKDYFAQCNWPNSIDWDYEIKKDIIEKALTLNKDEGIIDCGAHIGDGVIPIAHALKENNRSDIIVYALDPSPEKCLYIEFLAEINHLTNVKVICCGLSSEECTLYPQIPKLIPKHLTDDHINSGGTVWIKEKVNPADNAELYQSGDPRYFHTLDYLVETKQINHIIKIMHLDVEGQEKKVITGGIKTIEKHKPYITLETHEDERDGFENILQNNYKFIKRLIANNCFSCEV